MMREPFLLEDSSMAVRRPLSFEISETGCLLVISHRPNRGGYPRVHSDGSVIFAHRQIWEECYGLIPPGLSVLHRCDNPACINPEHLFLGTHTENMRDRDSKNRQPRGERQGHAILKENTVREIRKRCIFRDKENSCCALARQFGVSEATIRDAIHGRTWAWLE